MKSRRFACTHVRVCVHACVRGGQGGHDMSTSPRPREKVKLVVHFSVITFGSNRLTWCSCRRNEGGVCLLAESLRRSLNPSFINTSPSQIFKSSLNCRITGGGGAERGLRFLFSGHPSKTSISVPLLHSTPLYVCIGRDSKLIASGHNLEHQTCPQSNSTLGRQGSQTWGARKKSPKDQFCPAPSLLDTWSGAFGLNYPDSKKHSCQCSQTLAEDSISCLISSIQPVPPTKTVALQASGLPCAGVWTRSSSVIIKSV